MTARLAFGGGRAPAAGSGTVALVESPVQLLNVLEWAHVHPPPATAQVPSARDAGTVRDTRAADGAARTKQPLTVVVLSPTDPISRGQLRRMAELAREQGAIVRWYEARGSGGYGGQLQTAITLAPLLMRVGRLVIGDPFSRLVQLLLPLCRAKELTVVDDGTATMEFTQILSSGGRLVRWHRSGRRRSPADLAFGVFASAARRRLTPGRKRAVELFSAMPATPPEGMALRANRFAWTRSRFGPPRILDGTDLIGTSLVETGVVDPESYMRVVRDLVQRHGAKRYFAHRREAVDKLHRLAVETGLEIVRPDLPLELVARRGPIGRSVLSFPSTVVHTLPLALAGTGVGIVVVDIEEQWLVSGASPRAHTFLSGISHTARDLHGLPEAESPATA